MTIKELERDKRFYREQQNKVSELYCEQCLECDEKCRIYKHLDRLYGAEYLIQRRINNATE
jgi:hypothetical protein